MRNWGGERWWGEVGCWCVTFFSLLGLVVVEAVQNSPCWRKMRRKWVFRACRESFVPVERVRPVCRESFVPEVVLHAVKSSPCMVCLQPEREKVLPARVKRAEKGYFGRAGRVLYRVSLQGSVAGRVLYRVGPPGVRAGRALSRHRPRMRYKGLPAWSVCSPSVTKFAQHPESGPKCAFCGVPGEFCTGWACLGRPAPPQPTSRAPDPRESGRSATAWCRRRTPTPRPRPTRSG